jgi:hypothetical protein
MVFCRAVFDTHVPDRVRGLLQAHEAIRTMAGDDALVWKDAADGDRVLGTWFVEDDRVVLETTSRQRCSRGREWLESVAGELVRYRAMSLETLDEALQAVRRQPPSRMLKRQPDREEGDTAPVREMFDHHYEAWLDRALPALGNRTPRAAARTRLWRARLLDLLKQMENAAERGARHGRPPYDFSWLWRELGFARPGERNSR